MESEDAPDLLDGGLAAAFAPDAGEAAPPTRFGPYEILGVLGEGGMGVVYDARQDQPRRPVALKVIRPGHATVSLRRRFLREGELLGRLHHPGVAQVYATGVVDAGLGPQPFVAMERLEGRLLDAWVREERPNVEARCRVLARIADAVHHAHQRGVVHRDLKPGNVIVQADGQPRVLDFGVARAFEADPAESPTLTTHGQLLGTLPYMSPEQVCGDAREVDTRSDVYALGVLLYEVLAGRLPLAVTGARPAEAIETICRVEPTPLSRLDPALRGDLETIAATAMAKDPARRYASAAAFAEDLRRTVRHEPILARPASRLYVLRKFLRRHAALVVATGAVLAGILATTTIALVSARRAARLRDEAVERRLTADRLAYRLGIQAAAGELADANPAAALGRLESLPENLRGWEWRYLHGRTDESLFDLEADQFALGEGGQVYLAGPGAQVRLLDVETGATAGLPPHAATKWGFSRGNGFLVHVEADGIHVFDPRRGVTVTTLDPTSRPDRPFEFTYGQGRLAWASGGSLRGLDTATGGTWSFPALRRIPWALSPDGRYLAARGASPGTIEILDLDLDLGRSVATLGGFDAASNRPVAFSPDGSRLAVGEARAVRLFDARTGAPAAWGRAEGHTNNIVAVAFDREGTRLASGAMDRQVRLRDARTGVLERVLALRDPLLTHMAFDVSGRRFLTHSGDTGGPWRVRVWDLTTPSDVLALRGHRSFVGPVAFSPDGARLVSGGWDGYAGVPGCLRIWDAATGAPVAALGEPDEIVESLAVSADGTRLYTCGSDAPSQFFRDRLRVWSAETGALLAESPIPYRAVAASPDGRWLAVADGEDRGPAGPRVHLLDPDTLEARVHLAHPAAVRQVLFSPDGDRLATASVDGTLRLWRVAEHALTLEIPRRAPWSDPAEEQWDGRLSFSPDGARLLVAEPDGIVRILDSPTGRSIAELRGHGDRVYDVVEAPDGRRLFSCGKDQRIRLWNAQTFAPLLELTSHESYVRQLAISKDGATLVSSSGDGTLRIWETAAPRVRLTAIEERARLVTSLRPRIERWFSEGAEPAEVVRLVRADASLEARAREVALQLALTTAQARRAPPPQGRR